MDYREYGGTLYIRMDRGDEIVEGIQAVCEKEGLRSAVYTGIGGLSAAEIQVFDPASGAFETSRIETTIELASMTGNVVTGADGKRYHHTHAVLAFRDGGDHRLAAGHVRSLTVLYTAEIELRPVTGGEIGRRPDPETGTGFWDFG